MREAVSIFAFVSCLHLFAYSQPAKPIKWSVDVPEIYSVGDTVRVQFTAAMEDGWYMYSTDTDSTEYLTPASLRFSSDPSFRAIKDPVSVTSKNKYIEVDDTNVRVMEGRAVIEQELIVRKRPLRLNVELEYFVVKDEGESGWVIPYIEKFNL